MRVLWTFLKVVLALALLVPISIIVLSTALGLLGALLGLAFFTLRIAVVALVIWGVFRLGVALFGGRRTAPDIVKLPSTPLPPVDPYYEAAKRELDNHLGESSR